MMKDSNEHLGTLVLGYMWNQPLQRLNSLLAGEHPEKMNPEFLSGLNKLTDGEKRAFKGAMTSIFAEEVSRFFGALDEVGKRGEIMEIADQGQGFSGHLPPWNDHFSYFDKDGNPKTATAAA